MHFLLKTQQLVNEISCLIKQLLMFVDANAHFYPPRGGYYARLLATELEASRGKCTTDI